MSALGCLPAAEDGWIDLFDGRILANWRPSENKSSWKVVDGSLAADGPRSHLFYNGPVHGAVFKNFELEVEALARPACNSGVYFHTAYQETGFPEKGFEIQIDNTATGRGHLPRAQEDRLALRPAQHLQAVHRRRPVVQDPRRSCAARTCRSGSTACWWWITPSPPRRSSPTAARRQRFLDRGTFALQCHNDGIQRALPQRPRAPAARRHSHSRRPLPWPTTTFREIIDIGRHNHPHGGFPRPPEGRAHARTGAGQVAARRHRVRHRRQLRQGLPHRERRGRARSSSTA